MAYSKNRIEIMGHLGADPELKNAGQQNEWYSFRIAVSNGGYTTKEGREIPEKTNWFNCAAFGQANGKILKFAKKGERIEVVGEMDCREVEENGVKNRYWGVIVREVYPIDTKVEKAEKPQSAPFNPFGSSPNDPF